MNPWAGGSGPTPGAVRLQSPLPPDECCRRLQAAMDTGWTVFGSKPVIGSVANGRLQARKRIGYRNSFQTSLTADLVAHGGGTLVTCRFGMHPFVRLFMAAWLGIVGLVAVGVAVLAVSALVSGEPWSADAWPAVLIPAGMFAFGLGLLWLGRYPARNDEQFLTDFMCATLQAHPVPQP